jgi:hypothetical protein
MSSTVFGGTDKTFFGSTDKTTRSEIGTKKKYITGIKSYSSIVNNTVRK